MFLFWVIFQDYFELFLYKGKEVFSVDNYQYQIKADTCIDPWKGLRVLLIHLSTLKANRALILSIETVNKEIIKPMTHMCPDITIVIRTAYSISRST